jgi:NitT/TauT family transport system substrate-binding protein
LSACGGEASGDSDNGSASGQEPISIALAATPGSVSGLPAFVADELGIFEENGLDVELVPITSSQAMLPALEGGSLDVIPSSVSQAIQLRQKGSEIKVVAGLNRTISYGLIEDGDGATPAATDVGWEETIRALSGKTIGVSNGETSDVAKLMRDLMDQAGGDPSSMSFLNVAFGGPTLAAIEAKQIDVGVADLGTLEQALSVGYRLVLDFPEEAPEEISSMAFSAFIATESVLAESPELADRFLSSMEATYEFMQDSGNLPDVHRVAVEVAQVPDSDTLENALGRQAQIYRAVYDEATVQSTMDLFTSLGMIPGEPAISPQDLYTEQAMPN